MEEKTTGENAKTEVVELTEEFILKKSGQKTLSAVTALDLSELELNELPVDAFYKVPNLETLNLAKNHLQQIPKDLGLVKLRKLDVSENKLSSLEFVKQFALLEELYVEGNGLEPSDKYIAAWACPSIKTINRTSGESLNKMIDIFRQKLEPEVHKTFKENYADKTTHKYRLPEQIRNKMVAEISAKVKERKMQLTSLDKFRDFLIDQLCQDLLEQVKNDDFEPVKKKQKLSDTPTVMPSGVAKRKSKKKQLSKALGSCLPSINDYDPIHFVRCHFGDRVAGKSGHQSNDPTDDITKVWCCQFEPHATRADSTTGIVATCGGDTVCLLDCSTGKVLKRYQQAKEQFYCLAWTTLSIDQKSSNVLAVGGSNGHLKLLHPDQLVCYKQLGTGRPNRSTAVYYISCLLFHPTKKTWLFSGASDTTITLWDIGIPVGATYDVDCKVVTIFHATEGSGILNMIYDDQSNYLVAGCETSCFGWSLEAAESKRHREPNLELVLPGGKQAEVDGMTLLADDFIASKCAGENCIYFWCLSSHLSRGKTMMKVEPLVSVEWCETEVEYINLGSKEGVLACGDDRGNIWLYNVKDWLMDPTHGTNILRPSRILPWPYCQLAKGSSLKMTDLLDPPEEIVVNCVTISSSAEYIVTGTDNNLVCIWRKTAKCDLE